MTDFNVFCATNNAEINSLASRFADFQPRPVTPAAVTAWLGQFKAQHRPLALKFAGGLKYFDGAQIQGLMVPLFNLLVTQLGQINSTLDNVIFVPAGKIGESGLEMARKFRNANKLVGRQDQFVLVNEILSRLYKVDSPVVALLDDFVGTGKQVHDWWRDVLSALVPEYIPTYLLVVAAFREGADRVERDTPIRVLIAHPLNGRHQLMASGNMALSKGDKQTVERYCNDAGNHPLGHGNLGAIVSFAHDTPNNSVSVIRGSKGQEPWSGLLPRWDDL